jgi:catechol 2,3-dioxygenase-like lactoylglutathione lyase family enzyme
MDIRVKLVSIPVADQQRSVEFFTEKLGFRVTTDQPMGPGARWIELTPPGGGVRVVPFVPQEGMGGAPPGGFGAAVFTSSDVEATYNELVERGVEFMQPYKEESWGASCIFKDPDGNAFVIGSDVEAGVA